ncbi:hypothetical protein BDM02DRAFT_3131942 [Thelephora ganbajun]|uniref:Uncharacterized protein n=1 Tax=Thelephora ganbajun TaxID=370292 RepID=A0ACB6Z3Q5_THEGA|nr:hypothetical protein BDM02DRAFT_3131942 [Thelephora ganbajun]
MNFVHETIPVPTRDQGWETTQDQIKHKRKDTSSHSFHVYRVQDVNQLDKIPKVPGTVIIFEDSREIWCVNDESNLCLWDGNSGSNQRWRRRILHWNGKDFDWACASGASVRSRLSSWETVNHLRGADIVAAIISGTGLTKPRSKQREPRGQIDDLQAAAEEKDDALARVTKALDETIKENYTLQVQLQAITGTPPHAPYYSHGLPSSLASVSPDVYLGDGLYAPLCDSSDQPLSSDESTLNIFQCLQPHPHSQRDEENWNVDGLSKHPTIFNTSSTLYDEYLVDASHAQGDPSDNTLKDWAFGHLRTISPIVCTEQKRSLFDLMANYGVDATLPIGQSPPFLIVLEYPSAETKYNHYGRFVERLRAELKDFRPVLVRDWLPQLQHQSASFEEHVFSYFGGESTEVSWRSSRDKINDENSAQDYKGEWVNRKISIGQFLKLSGIRTNCGTTLDEVNLLHPQKPLYISAISDDLRGLEGTNKLSWELSSNALDPNDYPAPSTIDTARYSAWKNVTHPGYMTLFRHDIDGLCTWASVSKGARVWCYLRANDGYEDIHPNDATPWTHTAHLFLLIPGYVLIQPPGVHYAVYTPVASMTLGGRFLCLDSLSATLATRLSPTTNVPNTISGHGYSIEKVMRRMLLWVVYRGDTNLHECFAPFFSLNDDSPKKHGVKKRGEGTNAEDLDNEVLVCTRVATCVAETITGRVHSSAEELYRALKLLSIGGGRGTTQIDHYKRAQELPIWRHGRTVPHTI